MTDFSLRPFKQNGIFVILSFPQIIDTHAKHGIHLNVKGRVFLQESGYALQPALYPLRLVRFSQGKRDEHSG